MGLAGLRIPLHQLGWGGDGFWPLPPSLGVGALMVPFIMSLQVFPGKYLDLTWVLGWGPYGVLAV